jgi:hypothetical protein
MIRFIDSLRSMSLLVVFISSVAAQNSKVSSLPATLSDSPLPNRVEALRPSPASFDEVIDRVAEREQLFLAQMQHLRPIVETYLQNLKSDRSGKVSPVSDQYFLGHLGTIGGRGLSFVWEPEPRRSRMNRLAEKLSIHFERSGFAQMVALDTEFDKTNYIFSLVRSEFLGELRCLVIDVQPKPYAPPGRFKGRIWVEDQEYSIVRFKGTYSRPPLNSFYLHFDSWRLNLKPGLWLPVYIYVEESGLETAVGPVLLKAQTRFWGYDLKNGRKNRTAEFTQILVDSQQPVRDETGTLADATPVAAQRLWEHQAEDNVIERLESIGLLAPAGGVDRVLQTVVNNLLISNSIDLQSDVRCRVLLTAPLESMSIGHTIIVSRGLLDVLPDEASLGMVLAHEVRHIVLGHPFDTKLSFNDRMFFPDEQLLQRLRSKRRPEEEQAADKKALELLKNSPYGEKLGSAGLFLELLQQRERDLRNLVSPHLGDSLAAGRTVRMSALLATAPQLDEQRIDQIAALPLGGRIKLDPWTDQVTLAQGRPVILATVREKIPFELTPFFPYLTRLPSDSANKIALTQGGSR